MDENNVAFERLQSSEEPRDGLSFWRAPKSACTPTKYEYLESGMDVRVIAPSRVDAARVSYTTHAGVDVKVLLTAKMRRQLLDMTDRVISIFGQLHFFRPSSEQNDTLISWAKPEGFTIDPVRVRTYALHEKELKFLQSQAGRDLWTTRNVRVDALKHALPPPQTIVFADPPRDIDPFLLEAVRAETQRFVTDICVESGMVLLCDAVRITNSRVYVTYELRLKLDCTIVAFTDFPATLPHPDFATAIQASSDGESWITLTEKASATGFTRILGCPPCSGACAACKDVKGQCEYFKYATDIKKVLSSTAPDIAAQISALQAASSNLLSDQSDHAIEALVFFPNIVVQLSKKMECRVS